MTPINLMSLTINHNVTVRHKEIEDFLETNNLYQVLRSKNGSPILEYNKMYYIQQAPKIAMPVAMFGTFCGITEDGKYQFKNLTVNGFVGFVHLSNLEFPPAQWVQNEYFHNTNPHVTIMDETTRTKLPLDVLIDIGKFVGRQEKRL